MSQNLNVVLLDINTRGHLQQYLFNVLLHRDAIVVNRKTHSIGDNSVTSSAGRGTSSCAQNVGGDVRAQIYVYRCGVEAILHKIVVLA